MWQAIASAGIKVATAFGQHRVAKAQYALGAAKAKYENAIRQSRNQLEAAGAALSTVAQGIANRRRLDAAGKNFARGAEAISRSQEAFTANAFSRRVQAAEAAGAATAQAAFSGVTGGNVSALVTTAALRADMVEELAGRQEEQTGYELRKNASEQLASGIAGLDQRLIRPNMDLAISVNQAPDPGSLLGALTHPEVFSSLAGAAVNTYNAFQTPRAPASTGNFGGFELSPNAVPNPSTVGSGF
jgi:hypothetical protein